MPVRLTMLFIGFVSLATAATADVTRHGGALTHLNEVSSVGTTRHQQLS